MPMNDLQINLALAEIEGIKVSLTGSSGRAFLLIVDSTTKDSVWEPTVNSGQAFRLLVKSGLSFSKASGEPLAYCCWMDGHFTITDESPTRVICLAVLKKEKA